MSHHHHKKKEEKELPAGWYKTVDPNTKRTFYYTADGKKQWHFPTEGNEGNEGDNKNKFNDEAKNGDVEPDKPILSSRSKKKSSGEDVVDTSSDVESLMPFILKIVLFPFQSSGKAAIWFIVQLVFCVFELLIGILSLPGQGEIGTLKSLLNEFDEAGNAPHTAFLPVFLIVDGVMWLIEIVFHYVILMGSPAKYLLDNPPTFGTLSLTDIYAKADDGDRTRFWLSLVAFGIFRLTSLALSIVAVLKLALMNLSVKQSYILEHLTTLDKAQNYIRLTDMLRGTALVFIIVNFLSLTLWVFFFGALWYLHSSVTKPSPKKATSSL